MVSQASIQPDFQYFRVKMKAFRFGFSPDSEKKKQQTNPAGLTNASHRKRVVQQNPKTDSVLQYLGIPHYPNTIQYLAGTFEDFPRNLQESPQVSPEFPVFSIMNFFEDLDRSCWWFGTQYTLVLLSWRRGAVGGDWGYERKWVIWEWWLLYAIFLYMMFKYIYIYVYMRYMHIQILHICVLYLVVNIFIYNLYFVYRYLYFKGKLYFNFKGFFGVEAMDLSCLEWWLDCQTIGNLFFLYKQGVGLSYQV